MMDKYGDIRPGNTNPEVPGEKSGLSAHALAQDPVQRLSDQVKTGCCGGRCKTQSKPPAEKTL